MSYSSSTSRGGGNSRGGGGRGRGEYYKNKYGGRGGRGSGGDGLTASQPQQQQQQIYIPRGGGTYRELRQLLKSIDGRQYPSYHDLETPEKSGWVNDDGPCGFTLEIGRAQSDPFAPPTRCRVTVPQAAANFPSDFFAVNRVRRMASADYVWRQLYQKCKQMGADQTLRKGGGGWSGPKGGDIQVMEPTQHVMEQSAIWIDAQGNLTCQLTVNLPARGRTVLGSVAAHILDQVLSQLVRDCLQASSLDLNDMRRHVDSIEDQAWLQNQLDNAGLVSFVRNGAILPRASGVDDRPLTNSSGQVIPFQSPLSLQTSFTLPNAGVTLTGMGIPKGITLICGGGFHGKSTLLQALQLAVYYKIPGDGREFCVTSVKAAKIRAEDGRCVNAVDISSFIKNLPFGTDTTCFTTADASGSTSQASNIVEVSSMRCTRRL